MDFKDAATLLANLATALSFVVLVFSLLYVVRSNNQVANSMRITALQQLLSEMNELRRIRASDIGLEQALFDARKNWDEVTIKKHLMAVQLANILEWAFIARRDGVLSETEWKAWAKTWREVILSSASLKSAFKSEVWTFGRDPGIEDALKHIFDETKPIPDPRSHISRWKQFFGE
jgi:hypothetical protein